MDGGISHSCLDKPIGKLSFSPTFLFGQIAWTQLRPLYQKLRRRVYSAQLSAVDRATFSWRDAMIADFTPRIAAPRPIRPHWVICTDAASTPAHLCALLFKGVPRQSVWRNNDPPQLQQCGRTSFATIIPSAVLSFRPSSFSPRTGPRSCKALVAGFTWETTASQLRFVGIRTQRLSPSWSPVSGD